MIKNFNLFFIYSNHSGGITGNIKNIVLISFLCINNIYNSDYYLFRFHPELPIHYRAEMFLLDSMYKNAVSNLGHNHDDKMSETFERMDFVISRLSAYKLAQKDYQRAVTEYKALKK